MSEPIRLLAGEGSEFERALLRTWESRQPSAEAKTRVMAIAGAGVAAGLAAAASSASASIAPKAAMASGVMLKWLAIGAIGATAAAGVAGYALRSTPAAPPSAAPAASHVVPSASAPLRTPADSTAVPTAPATSALPGVTAASNASPVAVPEQSDAPSVRPAAPAAHPREASTLDEEVGMIERARRAVAGGDGAGALALVDAYDAKFPSGSMAQESTEVRIEALLRQGDHAGAERLATRFIEAHPNSPYVRRIRALLSAVVPAR